MSIFAQLLVSNFQGKKIYIHISGKGNCRHDIPQENIQNIFSAENY